MTIFIAVIVADHEIYPEAFATKAEAEAWVLSEFNDSVRDGMKPFKRYSPIRMSNFIGELGASWMWTIAAKNLDGTSP